jgi:hypothetical protein
MEDESVKTVNDWERGRLFPFWDNSRKSSRLATNIEKDELFSSLSEPFPSSLSLARKINQRLKYEW